MMTMSTTRNTESAYGVSAEKQNLGRYSAMNAPKRTESVHMTSTMRIMKNRWKTTGAVMRGDAKKESVRDMHSMRKSKGDAGAYTLSRMQHQNESICQRAQEEEWRNPEGSAYGRIVHPLRCAGCARKETLPEMLRSLMREHCERTRDISNARSHTSMDAGRKSAR